MAASELHSECAFNAANVSIGNFALHAVARDFGLCVGKFGFVRVESGVCLFFWVDELVGIFL